MTHANTHIIPISCDNGETHAGHNKINNKFKETNGAGVEK